MLLVGLGIFVGLVVVVYWIGRSILGPIDRAAKEHRGPRRIYIADYLCLFVAVQIPLAFISLLNEEETELHFWILTILAWVIAPIIWVACAVALSRAGISSGTHRLIFMGLILPIVYYGLIPFVLMMALGIAAVVHGDSATIFAHPWLVAAWAGVGAALIACGKYTHWLVRHGDVRTALGTYVLEDSPA